MFVQWARVVGSCVHIGLLQWVEAGSVIRNQVILVQGLCEEEGTERHGEEKGDKQGKDSRKDHTKRPVQLYLA